MLADGWVAIRGGHPMAHLIDRDLIERANTVLLLGIVGGGIAACAIAAMLYDVIYWLQDW
jgi:hypothetical protein